MKTRAAQLSIGHLVSSRRRYGGFVVGVGSALVWSLLASTSFAQDPAPAPEEPPPAAEEPAPPPAEAPAPAPAEEPAPAPAGAAAPEAGAQPAPGAGEVAASPEDAAAPGAQTNSETGEVGEVVVTVDRRRKNLQDYSGTAASFSDETLRSVGINNVTNLSQVVPGLHVSTNNNGASIYIRGVGSDNTTELGDPAVAVHLDNVYLPRQRGMTAAWLDIERVEVNSGPQGTIRGRNASGGSVNMISRLPVLGEYHASAEATFGTFRQRRYEGMVNLPFGERVALRVAGYSASRDATWENLGPLDHLPGAENQDDYAGKASLRYHPNAAWDIVVAGDYTLQRGAGSVGAQMIELLRNFDENGTPNDATDDILAPIDPNAIDNPRRVFQRGRYPEAETEHWGVRLSATYDPGPMRFELLGSYRFLDWRNFTGSNAGYFVDPADLPEQQWDNWSFAQQQNNDSKTWVGEFRVASPDDARLVWSVGLFGYHEDQGAFLGQVTGDPGGFNEFNMPSTISRSIAAYADANFSVTEAFRVLGGIRYSIEHKDRLGGLWMIGNGLPENGQQLCARQNSAGECVEFGLANNGIGRYGTEGFRYKGLDRENYDVPGADATTEERVNFFLDGIESFGTRDQTAIALCNDPPSVINIDANGNETVGGQDRLTRDANGNFRCAYGVRDSVGVNGAGMPVTFTNTRPQNGERDDSYVDFRVGVEYDLAKENLLYATLSSGHKAGGFNDSFPDPDNEGAFLTPEYGPESAYALEIGSKNEFLDRRLRVNAAAFGYLYRALQFQTILVVGQPPPLNPDGSVATDPATGFPYPDPRGGTSARQNAEDTATVLGLDVDAQYALPLGFEVDLHALFVDARFPDGTLVNDGRLNLGGNAQNAAQVDIGGNQLPNVSPFTFNYSLSQLFHTGVGSFDWIVQGQTKGPMFFTAFNGDGSGFEKRGPAWGIDPANGNMVDIEADPNYAALVRNPERLDDRQATYTQFNLGAGWRHPDGLLSIRGFVNNVFNVAYSTFIFSTASQAIHWYNDPRMAGVTVRMDW
jgi:iron complex outermembrane receptor protein